jgi:hypothetical protein
LWPAMTMERLTTGDFIPPSVFEWTQGRTWRSKFLNETAIEAVFARPNPNPRSPW